MTLREPLGRRPPAATGRQVDCREAKALADLCALGRCQTAGALTTQPTALQATREPPTLPRLAMRLALNEAQLGVARAVPAAAAWGQCRCMILAGMNSEGTGAFLVRDATCCSVPVAHPAGLCTPPPPGRTGCAVRWHRAACPGGRGTAPAIRCQSTRCAGVGRRQSGVRSQRAGVVAAQAHLDKQTGGPAAVNEQTLGAA